MGDGSASGRCSTVGRMNSNEYTNDHPVVGRLIGTRGRATSIRVTVEPGTYRVAADEDGAIYLEVPGRPGTVEVWHEDARDAVREAGEGDVEPEPRCSDEAGLAGLSARDRAAIARLTREAGLEPNPELWLDPAGLDAEAV